MIYCHVNGTGYICLANIVTGLAWLEITQKLPQQKLIFSNIVQYWSLLSNIDQNVVPFNIKVTVWVKQIGPSLNGYGYGVDIWVDCTPRNRQEPKPQVKIGKTLNLRLFGVFLTKIKVDPKSW